MKKAGSSFVEIKTIVNPDNSSDRTLTIDARDKGPSGNNVYVRTRPMVGSTLNILQDQIAGGTPANTSVSATTVTWVIKVDDPQGLVDGDQITIKGRSGLTVKGFDPTLNLNTFEIEVEPPDLLKPEDIVDGEQGASFPVANITNTTTTATENSTELDDITRLKPLDTVSINSEIYVI